MAGDVNPWTVTPDVTSEPVTPPPQPSPRAREGPSPPSRAARGLRPGRLLAGLLALGASLGFGLWLLSPDKGFAPAPPASSPAQVEDIPPPAPKPAPLRFAAPEPNPQQVRRAYDEVRAAYSGGGPEALAKASVDCAKGLQQDPGRLDECLAFDVYAADILPPDGSEAAGWFRDAPDRDLALARAALPADVDAADRLGQVRALTTVVLPRPKLHKAKSEVRRHAAPHRVAQKSKAAIRPKTHGHRLRRPPRSASAASAWEPPATKLHDPPDATGDDLPLPPGDLVPPH